jgi:acyl-CoA thioester hydrolase
VEFFRQLGHDYKQMELVDDCHLPVVETSCRYRSPARYDEEIIIETRVTLLRGAVIKFGYRLLRNEADEERILAEAETVHVCVDKQMQKRNLPEKYAAAILETME